MKTFLERKVAFTFKKLDKTDKTAMPVPRTRIKKDFKKKASFIVTVNVADEHEFLMGEPCYQTFESHLNFEEIDTFAKLF